MGRGGLWTAGMLLVLTLALSGNAVAASEEVSYAVEGGNLTIYLDDFHDIAQVTGCDESVTVAEIPAEVKGFPVTAIGKNAFSGCTSLVDVTFPSGGKSSAVWAF